VPNFINLPPFTEDGDVHVVVETPRGSRAKFAYDPKLETFILSKSLLTGLTCSPNETSSDQRQAGKPDGVA
jgi:inorganic pyrophosphatase